MKTFLVMLVTAVFLTPAACGGEPLAIGGKAPRFELVSAVDGSKVAMEPGDGRVKVVVFTCNECPFAKAFEPRLIEIANRFGHRGVRFYAVDPNDDVKFPQESLAAMKARAEEQQYPFPYLKDGDSSIARAYGARVTPHVYVLDGEGALRYRGYVDDSAKPAERKTTALTDALNALLNGREVANSDTRAFGCTIKWKG